MRGVFEQRRLVNMRPAARPAIFCNILIWFCVALFTITSLFFQFLVKLLKVLGTLTFLSSEYLFPFFQNKQIECFSTINTYAQYKANQIRFSEINFLASLRVTCD